MAAGCLSLQAFAFFKITSRQGKQLFGELCTVALSGNDKINMGRGTSQTASGCGIRPAFCAKSLWGDALGLICLHVFAISFFVTGNDYQRTQKELPQYYQ